MRNPYAKKVTTTDRGYGVMHQAERKRWAPVVAAGRGVCVECGRPIVPGEAWHLAHDHASAAVRYLGVAHARCNIDESNRRRVKKARRWSRFW